VGLAQKIEESIESLPEKRKQIFKLSRDEGLKYKEIAERLGLSVKTVEAQMGLALKQLREKLKDYKDYFIGLFILTID
jgi:RNA polymerase sigma-70 factor (ECF subfamily)